MEPIIICFWCHMRVKPEEIPEHNHHDQRELQAESSPPANLGKGSPYGA